MAGHGSAWYGPVIDILVPVLARPANAAKVVKSIVEHTKVDYSIVFLCSLGDKRQINACKQTGARIIIEEFGRRSQYPKKMNLGFQRTDRQYLLMGADDLEFTDGWDENVLWLAEQSGAGVIGTNDCSHPEVKVGKFATHPLVRRSYIEQEGGSLDGPGTIFTPAYDHNYSDRELCHLAQYRGKWAFAVNSRIIHRHPAWGTAEVDPTYQKGAETISEDFKLFIKRSRGWGGIGVRKRVPRQAVRRRHVQR